jgi:hypothetical protein
VSFIAPSRHVGAHRPIDQFGVKHAWPELTIVDPLYVTLAVLQRCGGSGRVKLKTPLIVRVALPPAGMGTGPVHTHVPGWVTGTGQEPPRSKVHPLPVNSGMPPILSSIRSSVIATVLLF